MKEQKIDLKEMNKDNNQGKIVICQTDDGDTKIDVRFVDETVWLTQAQLCELYQTSKSRLLLKCFEFSYYIHLYSDIGMRNFCCNCFLFLQKGLSISLFCHLLQ